MEIISGIFYEKDFDNISYEDMVEIFSRLKPLITSSSANEVYHYMDNPNARGDIVKALKETMGNRIFMFRYAESLRYNKTNTAVAEFNLFSALSEYTQQDKVCGIQTEDGLKLIEDLLNNSQNITARDSAASKEEYEAFMDACGLIGNACKDRIKMNKSRIYNPKSEGANTHLGIIVRKLEQLEMAYKGINYVREIEARGLSLVGGSQY